MHYVFCLTGNWPRESECDGMLSDKLYDGGRSSEFDNQPVSSRSEVGDDRRRQHGDRRVVHQRLSVLALSVPPLFTDFGPPSLSRPIFPPANVFAMFASISSVSKVVGVRPADVKTLWDSCVLLELWPVDFLFHERQSRVLFCGVALALLLDT